MELELFLYHLKVYCNNKNFLDHDKIPHIDLECCQFAIQICGHDDALCIVADGKVIHSSV
jgi:hypothetical protein